MLFFKFFLEGGVQSCWNILYINIFLASFYIKKNVQESVSRISNTLCQQIKIYYELESKETQNE